MSNINLTTDDVKAVQKVYDDAGLYPTPGYERNVDGFIGDETIEASQVFADNLKEKTFVVHDGPISSSSDPVVNVAKAASYAVAATVSTAHGPVPVHSDPQANTLFYSSVLFVDSDGSPHSYGPNGKGLDYLANAGHPGNWFGVVTDSHGNPVIQGPNDPAPGYYVSATSLCDPTKGVNDPTRYANSEAIGYLACAAQIFEHGVKLGDVATVWYNGKSCHCIVADTGNRTSLGEGSVYLARQLGLCDNPKGSGNDPVPTNVRYVIYLGTADLLPGGHVGRLLTQEEINERAQQAMLTRGVDPTAYFPA